MSSDIANEYIVFYNSYLKSIRIRIYLLEGEIMNPDYYLNIGMIFLIFFIWVFALAVAAFYLISMWKIFVKAKKPGWAALIPFYSTIIELEILGRPWWFLLLMVFVPIANMVIAIILLLDFARVFGKSVGFGLGLVFLSAIFIPILAFSDARYVGPDAVQH